jgi:O-antigen/teichoic acid export membrane protein
MMRVVERQLLLAGGAATVGRYGLADRLASLLQMFIAAPFSQVFFVRRFETLARRENQQELERALLIFVAVMAAASLAFSSFGPEILSIIAPSAFRGAAELLPWLALSFVLASLNLNIELGILYAKRTAIVPIIGMIALAASVSLNFVLIPLYGAMGAAVTAVIVGIVRLLLTAAANGRWGTPDVSTNWPRVIFVLTGATLLGILATSQSLAALTVTTLTIRAVLWLLFALALFVALVRNSFSMMVSRVLPKRSPAQGG